MAKIEKFEDLECWKEARILVKQVFLEVQDNNKVDWDTKSQVRRATLSIMNNIAEGFGRYSDKEFIRFLEYSSSSAAEVRSMLYVFEDLNFTDLEKLKTIQVQLNKTRILTLGLIRYLKNKKP